MSDMSPKGIPVEPFLIGGRNLASLRRELALSTQDASLYPLGGVSDDPYTRTGIVTPEMFDPMIAGPRYNMGADVPGGDRTYSFASAYSFYRAVEAYPKCMSAIEQRIDTTVERDWVVEAGGGDDIDQQAADAYREVLDFVRVDRSEREDPDAPMLLDEQSGFDAFQEAILDALFMGFSAHEILWDRDGSLTYPSAFKFKHQHRFNMYLGSRGWEPRLLTREHTQYGVQLPQKKFLIYRHRPKFGPFGRGYAYELSPSYLDALDGLRFWMVHAQRYAGPTTFIEVPPNASDKMIEQARAAADNIGQEAANTLPQGMKLTTVEGKVGQSGVYRDLVRHLDGQISQLILGQTGTLDQSGEGGSRSQDEVADSQTIRRSKKDSDNTCRFVDSTFGSWFTKENFPTAKLPRLRRLYPELETRDGGLDTAKRDQVVVSLAGRRLKEEYLTNTYGIELEDEGGTSSPPIADAPLPDLNEPNPQPKSDRPLSEGWKEEALRRGGVAGASVKKRVEAVVDAAFDPNALIGELTNIATSRLGWDRFAVPLAEVMHIAHGLGMLDVEENAIALSLAEGFNPLMGFDAAKEALASKVPVPTERWNELEGEAQAWAFTAAGVMVSDALVSIQDELNGVLKGDRTFDDFKDAFSAIYEKTGIDPLAPWRIELLYTQNISNSYAAGEYERSQDAEFQEVFPYRQYSHGGANEPRPSHVALDGFVARSDDPVWQKIFVPNGFGCGCSVDHISQGEFEAGGFSLSDPLPGGDRPSIRIDGKDVPIADDGFNHPPGISRTREAAIAQARERLPAEMMAEIDKTLPSVGVGTKEKEEEVRSPITPVQPPVPVSPFNSADPEEYKAFARQAFSAELAVLKEEQQIGELDEPALLAKKQTLFKELMPLMGDRTAPGAQEKIAKITEEIKGIDAAMFNTGLRDRKLAAMEGMFNRLVDRVPESEADVFYSNIEIRSSFTERLTPERQIVVEQAMKDAYRLYGGNVSLKRLQVSADRAWAQSGESTINAGVSRDELTARKTAMHELAHILEEGSEALGIASGTWRDRKADDDELYLLRDLQESSMYGDDEYARKDNYFTPYTGKVYYTGTPPYGQIAKATEVMAVGAQEFATPASMLGLYQKDEEHFMYVLGVFAAQKDI